MRREDYQFLPKHDVADRSFINHNGAFIPNAGIYVRSGSMSSVAGGTTGSLTISFDASALRVRRVEVFHSGAAANFNFRIENVTPNTGFFFDPRYVIVCYREVPGSDDFKEGVDQVEDLYALTDHTSGSEGNLYLKFMPYSAGLNDFKYLLFFEAATVYVNREGVFHE